MLSLAEKIEASKACCRKAKDYVLEKKRAVFDQLFDGDCDVFVIRRDEKTGQFFGKTERAEEGV
jgi:hypothetical protein